MRIQDLCRGGGERDIADTVQRSRGGGKNLGLRIGGQRSGVAPGPPLDPHLGVTRVGDSYGPLPVTIINTISVSF